MTAEQKKQVIIEFDKNPEQFSCYYCKAIVGVISCWGCPLYSWGHEDR